MVPCVRRSGRDRVHHRHPPHLLRPHPCSVLHPLSPHPPLWILNDHVRLHIHHALQQGKGNPNKIVLY